MVRTLVDKGANPNVVDALYRAIYDDNVEIAKYLLDKGANPNSGIHYAISYGRVEITRCLVEHGADLKTRRNGTTTLHKAVGVSKKEESVKIIKYLVEHGVDVNATDVSGATALHEAVREGLYEGLYEGGYEKLGNLGIVKCLVEHGANMNATDANGLTIMDYAITYHREKIAQYLVDHGADVNHKDEKGCPLLMRACFSIGHSPSVAIVKCLVEKGADINATYKGQTVLDVATEYKDSNWGSKALVSYLKSRSGKQTGLISQEGQTRKEAAREAAEELAREDGSIGLVKNLIRRSGGAKEFVNLASQSGFAVEREDALGLWMVGHDCSLVLGVLASRGPDSLWSLQHKGSGKPNVGLIREGRRTF
jgi:ankyrin repeat protein